MGIKYLNRHLQSNCSNSIKQISLRELSGKKIVVDTSIYLYRFLGENALLENFYLMISIFREHNIIPLFVFDGKPPKEKEDLLKQRKLGKKEAETKYKELKTKLEEVSDDEKKELEDTMLSLKKEFIRLHHTDIENVKLLIQAYGISYIEAPGEADKLCAKMVCKHKAYACLSEDMDLFVYGCPRVLRYLSLLKKKAVMYDLKGILNDMKMTFDEFQSICIVSGTDYNIDMENNTNLTQTLKHFKKYKQLSNQYSDTSSNSNNDINNDYSKKENNNKKNKINNNCNEKYKHVSFYEWLEENTKYIKNCMELYNIQDMFDLTKMTEYKHYEKISISNGPIHKRNLMNVLEKEHFLFVE
jgi:5'-3' exonuclease